jgi:outer membrane protein assembly factor BamB
MGVRQLAGHPRWRGRHPADVQKSSFLAAFDLTSGKELWRTARQDVPTWSTPTIHQVGGQTQILINGWHHMGAYDFKTGREIWKLHGGGDIPVPTPVAGFGLVYITNAHGPMSPVYAIREQQRATFRLPTIRRRTPTYCGASRAAGHT